MTSPDHSRRPMNPAVVALVVASVLWGTTGTAASLLGDSVSPIAIGASTMAIGGVLLFAVAARSSVAAIRDRAALPWLLFGAVGVVVYPLAFYSGMNLAGVAIGNVVALGSGPVFAALFEFLWERQRLSLRGSISMAIAVVGVVILGLWGRPSEGVDGANVGAGVLLGLVAGMAYALYTYCSGRVIRLGHSGGATMGSAFGIGAIGLAPVLIATGAPILDSASNVGIAAYLAIGPMFIAYVLFGRGLGILRSSAVTTITLLEPLVATLLAVVIVGERLSVLGWIAIVIIFCGISVLVTARPSGKPSPRQ